MALVPGTTEWEDIHVRLGNFAPRPLDPNGNEIQDAVDECVDDELEKIRAKRLQDMKRKVEKEKEVLYDDKIKTGILETLRSANTGWCNSVSMRYLRIGYVK